ncbi:MAG: hypothetical protein QNK11_04390 [Legionella sp.]|nr:hypothetical protein [Legionella sp.]
MAIASEGINLYLVTKAGFESLAGKDLGRCLVVTVENGELLDVTYHDLLNKDMKLNASDFNCRKCQQIAQDKGVDLQTGDVNLLYANPQELSRMIKDATHKIRAADEIIHAYFETHQDQSKLSRKISGLSRSYLRDENGDIIELQRKDECRFVWLDAPPTQPMFDNLPENTSACFVVVPDNQGGNLFYIKKGALEESNALGHKTNLSAYETYQFNNQALSKAELDNFSVDFEHIADSSNVYGKGGFGRVKKSQSISADDSSEKKATKIQKQTIGPKESLQAFKREAKIAYDLSAGRDDVTIQGNKAYFHMDVLGQPISKVMPSSMDDKIDLSIKFLIEVAMLHSGDASRTHTKYAHRDLKTANVLIDDKSGEVRLIDFGFTTENVTTKDGSLSGTAFYAPLDQGEINRCLPKNATSDEKLIEDSDDYEDAAALELPDVAAAEAAKKQSFLDESWGEESEVSDDSPYEAMPTQEPAPVQENKDWTQSLMNPDKCLTKNYLEDDKIAALRTIYCNPNPKPSLELSIFNESTFAQLPEPIQEIFDATTIAPLLTDERRSEGLYFFAAVMIFYQNNPGLSDDAYRENIPEIRLNPTQFIDKYTQALEQDNHSILSFDESRASPKNTLIEVKPMRSTYSFKDILKIFTNKGNRSVSPGDELDEASDSEKDKSPKGGPKGGS